MCLQEDVDEIWSTGVGSCRQRVSSWTLVVAGRFCAAVLVATRPERLLCLFLLSVPLYRPAAGSVSTQYESLSNLYLLSSVLIAFRFLSETSIVSRLIGPVDSCAEANAETTLNHCVLVSSSIGCLLDVDTQWQAKRYCDEQSPPSQSSGYVLTKVSTAGTGSVRHVCGFA